MLKKLTMDARWIIYGNDKESVLSTMNYILILGICLIFSGQGSLK
jgi:hypothetical protein